MAQSFGEYASPTDTIAAILGTYPFSIGLFRELIQNSDDAKGTKQIFVLDSRTHGTTSLFHPNLADAQGPAVLAYNDALFSHDDWEALQSIHRSSKKSDISKIGKYGIGFRSCYHLTDHPQILSGASLAILDPQHTFSDTGGAKFDVEPYSSHKTAFDFFNSNGSVIRLPLRLAPSSISKQVITANEVRTLFTDFIREELAVTLLFLKHVRRIEIWEVDSKGRRTCIAVASISKDSDGQAAYKARVDIDQAPSHEWRILQSSFDEDESASLLSQRISRDARPLLQKHKLFPNIAMAVPLESDLGDKFGRLFTYLPLPIRTGFPCHIHGLFALTQSRQNLANKAEVGIVKGSDDSVLIEWNQMLFDEYLPRAWTAMLRLVVEDGHIDANQVYGMWPRMQAHVETGDSLYWTELPAKFLSSLASAGSPLWPLIPKRSSGKERAIFLPLSQVSVASDTTESTALQCMADAGLAVVKPPEYILDLLRQTGTPFTALVPGVAHSALLGKTVALESMAPSDHLALLEYLLSLGDLECIVGLPIVPLTSGKSMTLQPRAGSKSFLHVLIDEDANEIWDKFDPSALPLKGFSSAVRDLFVRKGPATHNVELLTPEIVAKYLKKSSFGLDFSSARQLGSQHEAVVLWLSRFWEWVGKWTEQKNGLLLTIRSFHLVPARNVLVSPAEGVFEEDGLDRQVTTILQRLGIAFLHASFSSGAKGVLRSSFLDAILSPTTNIHALLDRLTVTPDFCPDAHTTSLLLDFFIQAVLDHCRVTPLSESQQNTLRTLPMFPILTSSPDLLRPEKMVSRLFSNFHNKAPKSNTTKKVGPIPHANRVYGVNEATSVLLPLGRDITFLDGSGVDLALLAHLNPENSVPLTEVDVVGLALEHFTDQSKYLQTAFMEYMVQHRDSLPPRLIAILRKVKFIPTTDGSLQSLEHVIDPQSPLATLYFESADRVPRSLSRADEDVAAMLKQLRTLGVLRGTLSPDIVYERIQHISATRETNASASRALSIRLIDILSTSGFDATKLEIPVDAKWVPTNRGMLGHEECLDKGLHRPELFDEVLPLVDDAVNVSSSLRTALGWDKPLSPATLTQQLSFVVAKGQSEETYKKMRALIKELSKRELLSDDWATLRSSTTERPWIPISPRRAAMTSHAVFYLGPLALPGFDEIPPPLAERPAIRAFLKKMGCMERPSTSVLIAELKKLEDWPASKEKLQSALMILNALPMEMSEEERDATLVPDIDCNMRPSKELYFNDIGDRAFLEAGGLLLAHPRVDDKIARRLHMTRLGLKFLHLKKNPGLDMGEQLTTTIRNTLKQYTEQQTLTEFFANASDAGAMRMEILVDDAQAQAPEERLLCPAMAPFQRCPSLVIYNDSVFTQADFDGICMTGVGGKVDRTDTIGQFGLGALSMFHFTELGMIVSGGMVLFLNPSKAHLPLPEWASLLLPLHQMQKLYPDHLATLDGLFGFHLAKTTNYNGTIFRLPLRSDSHIGENAILRTVRDSEYVRDQIVRPYWRTAQQSLLFSSINSVATYYRTASRRMVTGWSLKAERGEMVKEGGYSRQTLQVTGYPSPDIQPGQDTWHLVYASVPISELPQQYLLLREPHRLRVHIVAGLAARTSSESWESNHSLFSTLPLPMTTTLPVHLTASFILTPDRRHIRFDDYDNLESKYNRWLLSSIVPPLYLHLLETLHQSVGHNDKWWPGNTTQQDNVTRVLVDSFYQSCLPNTALTVCTSYFDPTTKVAPSDAVILGSEPEDIRHILRRLSLSRYVAFPPIIQERCSRAMKVLNQDVLKDDLVSHADHLASLFESGVVTIEHIHTAIRYLQQNDTEKRLLRLRLVPLANGSLALIHPADHKTKLYVWKSSTGMKLFSDKDLVHPNFDASLLLNSGYNVCILREHEVANLIQRIIPEQPSFDTVDPSQDEWILNFWKEYNSLGMSSDVHARGFPLIFTARTGHYVSLRACEGSSVMVLADDLPECVSQCLNRMGASVVSKSDSRLPSQVRISLHGAPAFKFDNVLKYLEPLNIPATFALLDDDLHREFAEWCRGQVSKTSASLKPIAAKLPIWLAASAHSISRFRPANEISMLPHNFPGDVIGTFATKPCVEFSDGLRHLVDSPLSLDDVYDHLNMQKDKTLDSVESPTYKRMISALLSDTSFTRRSILLPNGQRTLVLSDTLYARQPLFIAAFGASSLSHFLHEEYSDLETRLGPFGMKTQNKLDLETFLLCAKSINDAVSSDNRVQRAELVFRAYCEELPLHMGISEEAWKPLDKIRFIPREQTRQTALKLEEYSQYTKSLPPVVSPSEILLPKYEALAWTQRALLASEPSDRILVANSNLGRPTIPEVIQHLRVLAVEVARDYPGNKNVLSDLRTVYKWLDERQDEIKEELIIYHDEKLFLNVNDPDEDAWLWNSADEMFLNIVDNGDLKAVRKFLTPFRDLLYVGGVEEIINPTAPKPELTSVETQYAKWKAGYNEMRRNDILTDIVFVSGDKKRFSAHRSFLAPMSDYLKDLFCGNFIEAGPATAAEPIELAVEYSGASVTILLDFIYTGTQPDFEGLELATLLEILDLSGYWGFLELNQVTQARIIEGSFINPVTYSNILHRATELEAKFLLEACEFYEKQNKDAIERMKGGTRQPRKNVRHIPKKPKTGVGYGAADKSPVATPEKKDKRSRMSRMMDRLTSPRSGRSRSRSRTSSSATAG